MTTDALIEPRHDRIPTRHRHTVRLRKLDICRIEPLGSAFIRLVLTGPELQGFASLGFDDHVKMFFPELGQTEIRLPSVGPDGLVMPEEGPRPIGRDFTPSHYDAERGELMVDFAVGHEGPASNWARAAQVGDAAYIAGPRGSFVIPQTYDWHLLIADETGIPAAMRRLRELPPSASVVAILEVERPEDRLEIPHDCQASIQWVYRKGSSAQTPGTLQQALEALPFPRGDYFTWIGCESSDAKALRSFLIDNRGANPKRMRASGYWRRGAQGVHDHLDD